MSNMDLKSKSMILKMIVNLSEGKNEMQEGKLRRTHLDSPSLLHSRFLRSFVIHGRAKDPIKMKKKKKMLR